jgi:sugar/nucleoside kinase (ribokinase family)
VVGVGLATVDLFVEVPRSDSRLVDVSVFSMQAGGSATNILAVLSSLGVAGRYYGRIGDDNFGRFILRSLKELRIDASLVRVERGKVSPVSIIQIDETSRKRRIFRSRGNVTAPDPKRLPASLLDGARLLCLDGSHPALQAALAEEARARHIPVLLNASQLSGGMGELLSLADIVIGSERFASELAPSDDAERSLREITRLGPRVAVITLGEAGSVALEGNKLVQQESVQVPVVDTSGAGDSFCGAFAYAQLKGWPLERALPFANAAAGLTCRTLGARTALPTLAEIKATLKGLT